MKKIMSPLDASGWSGERFVIISIIIAPTQFMYGHLLRLHGQSSDAWYDIRLQIAYIFDCFTIIFQFPCPGTYQHLSTVKKLSRSCLYLLSMYIIKNEYLDSWV